MAVPAHVATVRFGTADGKVVRTVATVAGAGYRGRYAGAVRFASTSVGGYAEFGRFELLDGAGRVVYSEETDEDDLEVGFPRVGQPRRVAGRAGRPSLWQTNVRRGKDVDRCLSLTDGPAPGPRNNCQASRENRTVLLDASCATKRLSVGIAVLAGTRVFADTGGRFRRPVRLRRGLAVLTLPSSRPLRALTSCACGPGGASRSALRRVPSSAAGGSLHRCRSAPRFTDVRLESRPCPRTSR